MCSDNYRSPWKPTSYLDPGKLQSQNLEPSSSFDPPIWKSPDDRRRERLNSDLLSAVCRSDIQSVTRLLEVQNGPYPTAFCTENMANTLHIAAITGDDQILQILLKKGADLEARDARGRLPLHLAAWGGSTRCIQTMLQEKPSLVNAKVGLDNHPLNPLHGCGWEHDHREVVSLISTACADEGLTALHIASMHCQLGVVDFLLKNGANIQEKDQKGRTALDVAGFASTAEEHHDFPSYFNRDFAVPNTPSNTFPGPTAYSSLHPDGFVMPTSFFKPSDRSASPKQWSGPFEGHATSPKKEVTWQPIENPMEPVGIDAVGLKISKALHNVVSTLMNKGAQIVTEQTHSGERGCSSVLLHSAIASDEVYLIEMLLDNGASGISIDPDGDTPLHFAVRRKKIKYLKAIVERLKEGQIDVKDRFGLTALHVAVSIEWPEGVGYLLESKANIKMKTNDDCETVYHIAAKLGNSKLMEELLLVEGSAEVAGEKDSYGMTPLFRAVQKASKVVVTQLIKTAKSDFLLGNGTNILHLAVAESNAEVLSYLCNLPTLQKFLNELSPLEAGGVAPLHIAAENGNEIFTEILLEAGADPNLHTSSEPKGLMTAMHLAAKNGFRQTVEAILKYDTNCLNSEDKLRWKPLHYACAYGHGRIVCVMIQQGADLSDTIDFHGTTKSALDLMAVNVFRPGKFLENLLDSYIDLPKNNTNKETYLCSSACAINLDFELLLSAHDPTGRQLTFLNGVVNTDNDEIKEILIHPLVETFLYIKWGKLWKFYAVLLFFYFLHTIALTSYCAVIFIANYGNFMGRPILHFTVLCSLIPIIIAECLQIVRLERQYWKDHESWIKLTMIVTSGSVGYGSIFDDSTEWIRHFSSFAILTSWIELLFLCARFKYLGHDIIMFEKVIENVLTVLAKFSFLFLGFMFALMIHFEGAAPFANIWDSFCQSVVMLVELNYGGMFPESSTDVNSGIGRLIYVLYMIFVALAMMNLTVALAVSDIAVLEKQGRVEKLANRTSFLSFLETLVYNERLGNCIPTPQAFKGAHSFRSIDAILTVFPNRPGVLPQALKTALLQKALEPDKENPLTSEHFDKRIDEVMTKVENLGKDLIGLLKPNVADEDGK